MNRFGIEVNPHPIEEPCKHQFFEVADIGYQPWGTMTIGGKEQAVMQPHKGGKLVMCALCGERRQLWQDGSIGFFVGDAWEYGKKQ